MSSYFCRLPSKYRHLFSSLVSYPSIAYIFFSSHKTRKNCEKNENCRSRIFLLLPEWVLTNVREVKELAFGKFVSCFLCFYYGIFNDFFIAPFLLITQSIKRTKRILIQFRLKFKFSPVEIRWCEIHFGNKILLNVSPLQTEKIVVNSRCIFHHRQFSIIHFN